MTQSRVREDRLSAMAKEERLAFQRKQGNSTWWPLRDGDYLNIRMKKQYPEQRMLDPGRALESRLPVSTLQSTLRL